MLARTVIVDDKTLRIELILIDKGKRELLPVCHAAHDQRHQPDGEQDRPRPKQEIQQEIVL